MSDGGHQGWADIPLGQLGTSYRGVSYRPEHLKPYPDESTTTLLRATNIQSGALDLSEVQFVPTSIVSKHQFLEHGDIAVCMSNGSKALVGKSAPYRGIRTEPHTIGAFCSVFKPIDRSSWEFVLHLFRSQAYQSGIDFALAGSAINNLKNSDIESICLRLPPRAAWSRIATILTSLDTAIEKTEALIEKHQQIKAGLMHDLFTRGVLPNGQLRPPSAVAPRMYRETVIGKAPSDWEVSGLAAKGRAGIGWIRTGPFGSALKGEHWVTDGHPVITIGALGEGEFIEPELLFVGPKDAARLADFQLKFGDVVFSRVADVGRSVVIREAQIGWIMSSNLMRISVDESLVRADYLQMLLAADSRIKRQIRARVNSSGRDVANSEVLSQLRFPWPYVDEQDRIVALAHGAAKRSHSLKMQLAKLQQQKFGLMQDLLTGKVSVTVAEVATVPA